MLFVGEEHVALGRDGVVDGGILRVRSFRIRETRVEIGRYKGSTIQGSTTLVRS